MLGMGARQQLDGKSGEIWDNFAVEYEYPNGARMFSYCGQIKRAWSSVSEAVQGTRGTADPGGRIQPQGGAAWRYRKTGAEVSPYVQEHIDLIIAILRDADLNEGKRVTHADRDHGARGGLQRRGRGLEALNSTFRYGPTCSIRSRRK